MQKKNIINICARISHHYIRCYPRFAESPLRFLVLLLSLYDLCSIFFLLLKGKKVLDHDVIDAKGLIDWCQVIDWCQRIYWLMIDVKCNIYCPWWEWIDVKWNHSHMMSCIDEVGSMSCHWYMIQRWIWIDVISLIYDA